jgi:hypothetical protein
MARRNIMPLKDRVQRFLEKPFMDKDWQVEELDSGHRVRMASALGSNCCEPQHEFIYDHGLHPGTDDEQFKEAEEIAFLMTAAPNLFRAAAKARAFLQAASEKPLEKILEYMADNVEDVLDAIDDGLGAVVGADDEFEDEEE